jgi:hypothetical protein
VVADAVAVEPVSTPEFPANREINREFCRIHPLCEIFNADTRAISKAFGRIPYATEQGVLLERRQFRFLTTLHNKKTRHSSIEMYEQRLLNVRSCQ